MENIPPPTIHCISDTFSFRKHVWTQTSVSEAGQHSVRHIKRENVSEWSPHSNRDTPPTKQNIMKLRKLTYKLNMIKKDISWECTQQSSDT